MTKPKSQPDPRGRHKHTCSFKDVGSAEREAVNARRAALGRADVHSDLVGLALSGGGIRSASFCLGVLQALDSMQRLKQIDYLSTVSGGGYIGACLTTTLNARHGVSQFNQPEGAYGDTDAIRHVRDFSNYLIPRGFGDVVTAVGLLARGLLANAILIAPLFIGSVWVLLHFRPSRQSLRGYGPLKPLVDWLNDHNLPFLPGFPATTGMLACLLLVVLLWVIVKAATTSLFGTRSDARNLRDSPELQGGFVKAWKIVLVLTAVVAWLELQPIVLEAIADADSVLKSCITGGARQTCVESLLGNWFTFATPTLAPFATAVGFLSRQLGRLVSPRKGLRASTAARRGAATALLWVSSIVLPSLLWLAYLKTTLALMPVNAESSASGETFFGLGMAFWLASGLFLLVNPNATSLHRLYRDRLSKAFLFDPGSRDKHRDLNAASPRLHEIDTNYCPYPIINAALNIGGSAFANKRGRNADFFEFTPEYTGSEATGWVGSGNLEKAEPKLDLGTAMAISGAAVSPNMGSATIKPLVPTLALLNIRLGFWLPNPMHLDSRLRGIIPTGVYLYREIVSNLTEKSYTIYVTDGGNIENLGIHALLRRQCKLIIAVDAEADPALTFGAYLKLQRYARIDLGVLLNLPWQEVRDHALALNKSMNDQAPLHTPGPHIAIGRIRYSPDNDGILVYVKSSLTGDEADYILDYKSRHPDFPHETTGDQFFGEEQLEVYRALGFHAMRLFLENKVDVAVDTKPGEAVGDARRRLVCEVKQLLGLPA